MKLPITLPEEFFPLFMNSALPQNVTTRYLNHLITRGRNNDFEVISILQEQALHDGIVVGTYYDVIVRKPMPDHDSERASGVTVAQAIARALMKFGVSFK